MKDGGNTKLSVSLFVCWCTAHNSSRFLVCFWFWLSAAITFRATSVGKYWHGHSTHTAVCECEHAFRWHSFKMWEAKQWYKKKNGCTRWCVCLFLGSLPFLLFRYLYSGHSSLNTHVSIAWRNVSDKLSTHTHKESEWNRSWSLAFKNYYHTHANTDATAFLRLPNHMRACVWCCFFLTSDTDAHFWLGNISQKMKIINQVAGLQWILLTHISHHHDHYHHHLTKHTRYPRRVDMHLFWSMPRSMRYTRFYLKPKFVVSSTDDAKACDSLSLVHSQNLVICEEIPTIFTVERAWLHAHDDVDVDDVLCTCVRVLAFH